MASADLNCAAFLIRWFLVAFIAVSCVFGPTILGSAITDSKTTEDLTLILNREHFTETRRTKVYSACELHKIKVTGLNLA